MSEDERPTLVLLPVAEPDEGAPVTKESVPWCLHRRVRIDPTANRLYCRECEREVDPMEWLSWLAGNWQVYVTARDAARSQAAKADRELEDALRRLRNARARLARAQRGATREERLEDRAGPEPPDVPAGPRAVRPGV